MLFVISHNCDGRLVVADERIFLAVMKKKEADGENRQDTIVNSENSVFQEKEKEEAAADHQKQSRASEAELGPQCLYIESARKCRLRSTVHRVNQLVAV